MKNKSMIIIALVLLAVTSLACGQSVSWQGVRGSGNSAEKEYRVSNFDGVDLATMCDLFIEVGEEEALRIEAEDNLLPYFEVEVRDATLEIRTQSGVNLRPTRDCNCYLTVVALERIALSGSGNITAPDLEADDFSVTINGSGDTKLADLRADEVTLRLRGSGSIAADDIDATTIALTISGSGDFDADALEADTLDVRIPGSGTVDIAMGEVECQSLSIAGSGDYRTKGVASEAADVSILGSGTATIQVARQLVVRIAGSGDVRYVGNPEIDSSVLGSGTLTRTSD